MKIPVIILILFPLIACSQTPDEKDRKIREWIYDLPVSTQSIDTMHTVVSRYRKTNLELLKEYTDYIMQLSKELKYTTGLIWCYNKLGTYYMQLDQYDPAMTHYLRGISISDSVGNRKAAATIANNVGIIYDLLGQPENAKSYFLKARTYFEEIDHKKYMSILDVNLGAAYFNLKKYDSALYYFQSVIPFREETGDNDGLAIAYTNIADTQARLGNYSLSLESYDKARSLMDPHNELLITILLGISRTYTQLDKNKLALQYLDSGLNLALETKQKRHEKLAYSQYKEYYLKTGDFQRAFDYLEKEYALDVETRGEEVQNQVEVLNLKYEDEKKARQLALLEKQQAQDALYFYISIAAGVFVLVVAILLFILLRLKINNARLKEHELKMKLEHKTREATSYAINFLQKNELMQELTTKIDAFKAQADSKAIRDLNQMNKIINSSFRIDQDWENFKTMFEEIHSGFMIRLKNAFPDLGNAELKLCALLRLNMNLKESSSVLGTSPDSVKTARYRLRKKLGLETEDNLVDFLIRFDSNSQSVMAN